VVLIYPNALNYSSNVWKKIVCIKQVNENFFKLRSGIQGLSRQDWESLYMYMERSNIHHIVPSRNKLTAQAWYCHTEVSNRERWQFDDAVWKVNHVTECKWLCGATMGWELVYYCTLSLSYFNFICFTFYASPVFHFCTCLPPLSVGSNYNEVYSVLYIG
jgi:hypothetical protein